MSIITSHFHNSLTKRKIGTTGSPHIVPLYVLEKHRYNAKQYYLCETYSIVPCKNGAMRRMYQYEIVQSYNSSFLDLFENGTKANSTMGRGVMRGPPVISM